VSLFRSLVVVLADAPKSGSSNEILPVSKVNENGNHFQQQPSYQNLLEEVNRLRDSIRSLRKPPVGFCDEMVDELKGHRDEAWPVTMYGLSWEHEDTHYMCIDEVHHCSERVTK
jgi:hypothetical protein